MKHLSSSTNNEGCRFIEENFPAGKLKSLWLDTGFQAISRAWGLCVETAKQLYSWELRSLKGEFGNKKVENGETSGRKPPR